MDKTGARHSDMNHVPKNRHKNMMGMHTMPATVSAADTTMGASMSWLQTWD
jgi:hypothetical protein